MDSEIRARIEEVLGYTFVDEGLLRLALRHASLSEDRHDSNERLEFLGDIVLSMVVCDYLYRHYPMSMEGDLTKIKSSVVSRRICAEIARGRGLDAFLELGKGMASRPVVPVSVAAAVYESILGAIYLDGGMEAVTPFVLEDVIPRIKQADLSGHQWNFKSVLQQAAQQHFERTPTYILLDEKGPDHAKCFQICVELHGHRFSACWGGSKKEAEQEAALEALITLGIAARTESGEVDVDDGGIPVIPT
jgi:ribonuclease-3